jgi:hypothetical protein
VLGAALLAVEDFAAFGAIEDMNAQAGILHSRTTVVAMMRFGTQSEGLDAPKLQSFGHVGVVGLGIERVQWWRGSRWVWAFWCRVSLSVLVEWSVVTNSWSTTCSDSQSWCLVVKVQYA